MQLVGLLLALLILGFIISSQWNSDAHHPRDATAITPAAHLSAPLQVPTSPQNLPRFEAQLNQRIQDNALNRARAVEQAVQNQ